MLIGLVGKPSVGKSTFFKAATLADVEIASYPFTTIKANHGVGYVKVDCIDKEFNTQCNPKHGFCLDHNRFVPIDLMDVAGLVPGASEGKGLGNQFLDDLRQADAFIQIVDCSGTTDLEGKALDEGVFHNPCEDIIFLEQELDKWYYNIFMKGWKSFARETELQGKKLSTAIAKQFSGLKVNEDQVKVVLLKQGLPEKPTLWGEEQVKIFATKLREFTKPMIIAANKADHQNAKKNLELLKEGFPDKIIIPCSADSELALRQASKANLIKYIPGEKDFEVLTQLNEKQKQALEKIRVDILENYEFGTGVQEVLNKVVFDILGYLAIFPASANKLADSKGNILPDCFLLPKNSTALDFAYSLHSDFGNKFIKAIDAKTKRILGKDYELKNRDALEIISG